MDTKELDVQLVTIQSNLIKKSKRERYEKMGYDIDTCFLVPFKAKDRFEVLVRTLITFIDKSNAGEVFGICDDLNREIGHLLASLGYLINSTSYRKGNKYYDFDKQEIDRKLGRKR